MRRKKRNTEGIERLLFSFPYFKDKAIFPVVYFIRMLLSCLLCSSAMYVIAEELKLDINAVTLFIFTFAVCMVFSALMLVFNENFVLLGILLVSVILIVINKDILTESAKIFANTIYSAASGSESYSPQLFQMNTSQFLLGSKINFFYIVAAFLAFVCSASYFTNWIAAFLVIILTAPALISGEVSFYPSVAFFIAAFMGYQAIAFANGAEAKLTFKRSGFTQYVKRLSLLKKQSGAKFINNVKFFRSRMYEFGRYTSNAVTTAIAVFVTISIVAAVVPSDARVNSDEIMSFLRDAATKIGSLFSGFFGGDMLDGKGFFTADGSNEINITNEISINAPSNGTNEVLRVTLENISDKIYLRGDIGYEFTGNTWKSIAALTNDGIYDEWSKAYDIAPLSESLANYSTDVEYRLFRRNVYEIGKTPNDYFGMQTIKIDYLRKTNVLFMPLAPLDLNFRDNPNFNCVGDFVTNTIGKHWISSFETVALYPKLVGANANGYYDIVKSSDNDFTSLTELPMSVDEYKNGINSYKNFIDIFYTRVPELEYDNIQRFYDMHPELLDGISWEEYRYADNDLKCKYALTIAQNLANYFQTECTYSLNTDNDYFGNTKLGNFLFDTKSGHCALYATAMTLLLRDVGIPARYVTGFVVGGNGDLYGITDNGYEYPVYANNLHAWVEVWLEGVGWIPYDPTPASVTLAGGEIPPNPVNDDLITAQPGAEFPDSNPSITDMPDVPPEDDISSDINGEPLDPNMKVLKQLVGFAVLIAAWFFLLYSKRFVLEWLDSNENATIVFFGEYPNTIIASKRMYKFMVKLLSLQNIERNRCESPMEFAARVDRELPLNRDIGLVDIMPIFEKMEFAALDNLVVTDEERMLIHRYIVRLRTVVVYENNNVLRRYFLKYILFKKKMRRKGKDK